MSGTNTLLNSNGFKSQIRTSEDNYAKTLSKFRFGQTQASAKFGSSVSSDFNQKENSFDKEKGTDFGNLTILNTKFMVKTCPS
jgi:hypothetical protein